MTDQVKQPLAVDYSLPAFEFAIDGKVYKLRYDFGAFRAFQKLTGVDPFVPEFAIGVANLDSFLWAGLRAFNPEVTIEQLLTWLTPMTARPLLELAGDAYNASFPNKAEPGAGGASDSADPPKA